jgi:hypothetical protein
MYNLIGRATVNLAVRYVRLRYARPAGIALGLGVGAVVLGAAAYLLRREVPEG